MASFHGFLRDTEGTGKSPDPLYFCASDAFSAVNKGVWDPETKFSSCYKCPPCGINQRVTPPQEKNFEAKIPS